MFSIILLVAALAVIFVASFFVSRFIFRFFNKDERPWARGAQVIAFVATFLVLAIGIYLLFISQIRMER